MNTKIISIQCPDCNEYIERVAVLKKVNANKKNIELLPTGKPAGESAHECKAEEMAEPPVGSIVTVTTRDGEEIYLARVDRVGMFRSHQWVRITKGSFYSWNDFKQQGKVELGMTGTGMHF